MAQQFDAIIIGAGQAGPPLAKRLAKEGMRVALAERKFFGGTCVNTGCIPTKALVANARAIYQTRRGGEFGFRLPGPVEIDFPAIMARKQRILMPSRENVEKGLREEDGCTVFHEAARFLSPHEVQVGPQTLAAPKIFINVGGRATVPDLPGVHEVPFLTNSTLLDLKQLPQHLVIVGGSYISCEFAQMFRRFGSEVTILEKSDRLVHREDPDVSSCVREILEGEGITIRTDAECIHLKPHGEGVQVGTSCTTGEPDVTGSHVLLAVGRTPNTGDLGLDKAGVETDKHGYVTVDDQLRTNVEGIWAMGECNGHGAFTHTAYNDYQIVAGNLIGDDPRKLSDRILAYNMYIDPPLGHVGMTETEVRNSGRPALMAKRPMSKVGRADEKSETQGFMKFLVDAETKKIVGATILGVSGDEAIHSVLNVMYSGAPYTLMTHAMPIHPTVSELIPSTLESLQPLQ